MPDAMDRRGLNELPVIHAGMETLPQTVPSAVCLTCSVCCRFPERDSVLRPYFTRTEIERTVEAGLDRSHFKDPNGSQVTLVQHPSAEGYLCPAFDLGTSKCRVYTARPFDCQIYPLAIMWSADHRDVLLGWDTKCPFIAPGCGGPAMDPHGQPHDLQHYAEEMAGRLERDEFIERVAADPGLIGPYQEDVRVLRPLRRLSERLGGSNIGGLEPMSPDDRFMFETALISNQTPLSCYAFGPHYVWRDLFTYSWITLAGRLCLFAENSDGMFMPLPPLGHGPLEASIRQSFALMQQRNGGRTGVARIEGITEELKPELEALGYRVKPKDPDYLYRVEAVAALAGDRYKAQRNACNRFTGEHRFRVEPYRLVYREASLALYRRWAAQQEVRDDLDGVARHMLKDAAMAHAVGLSEAEALGLVGLVVFVEGSLCAYTLGYALPRGNSGSETVFCVLFEIADRSIPGLAQFIFRESCRYAADHGYQWVNTMDDSGLPSLARSKQAYHPARLVPQYIATLSLCH
jgi:uncharacterized protein